MLYNLGILIKFCLIVHAHMRLWTRPFLLFYMPVREDLVTGHAAAVVDV